MVRGILECTPEVTYETSDCFFFLSGSSGQGIAPTAPEMPEMERYEVSDAQPWCFFYQRPKTRPGRSRRRRPRDHKAIGPPSSFSAGLVVVALALPADHLLVERPSSSRPPGSSFRSMIKNTKAEHQKRHTFPFLAFLEP